VVQLNPLHYAALSGKGLCHDHLKERESAIECFERALQIYPFMSQVQKRLNELKRPYESAGDGV
jgi:tetratricopeptide (TPR) repeat protein